MGMMPEEIEKQFGVTTTSEFEEQMSEKKLPELSFVINEENEKYAEIIYNWNVLLSVFKEICCDGLSSKRNCCSRKVTTNRIL